jgi:hypothetical protein
MTREPRPKRYRMYVWAPPDVRTALERMATKEHRRFTDMIRLCIIREAKRQGIWQEEE